MSVDRSYTIKVSTIVDGGIRQASSEMDELAKKTGQAGEEAQQSEKHMEGMREVLRHINAIAPGAGEALHAALSVNPIMAASFAMFALVEIVKRFGEAAEKAREEAHEAFVEIEQRADAASQAIQDLKDKQDDFWQSHEQHQKEAGEKLASESALKAIQNQIEQQKQLLEAKKATELQEVSAAEKAGQISQQEADLRKAQIASRFRDLETGVAKTGADRQLEELNRRHEELENQRSQTEAALRSQQSANISPEAKAREEQIADLQKFISNLASKKLGGVGLGSLMTGKDIGEAFSLPGIMGGGKVTIENDQQTEMFHNQAQALLLRLEEERKSAQDNEKTLQSELDRLTNERNAMGGQANDLDQKIAGSIGPANQIAALNKLSDAIQQLTAMGIFGNKGAADDIFSQGISALAAHGPLSEQQGRQVQALNDLVQALGWPPQMMASLERMAQLHESTANVIAALNARLDQLQAADKQNYNLLLRRIESIR